MNEFCRKIRLAEYFHKSHIDDDSIVKPKSNFCPPSGRNELLDATIRTIKQLPPSKLKNKLQHNISRGEKTSVKKLARCPDIILKEADKGSAIIIMDVDYYKRKVEEIIENRNNYEELERNKDDDLMTHIQKFIKKHEPELTKKEMKYLNNFNFKTSNFYGLPKIHKSEEIKKAIANQQLKVVTVKSPADLKLRPIIAGTICPTHRLSHFLDKLLQPLVGKIASYIKDSYDFLRKIPEKLTEETELATLDVENLYGSIRHELGLEAVGYWLDCYPSTSPRVSKQFIMKALKIILENNNFHFDGRYFRQLRGTAMGTKVAPTYATLTLGYLERRLFNNIDFICGQRAARNFCNNFYRFLDDVIIFYNKNDIPLDRIVSLLNELDSDIHFTVESSGHVVNFLDIKMTKVTDVVETDIFYKLTDTKQYLNFFSHHPRHTKRALPYNLARRICVIVSNEENRGRRLDEMKSFLKLCNYPKELIEDSIKKALSFSRETLLQGSRNANNSNDCESTVYVSTYNTNRQTNVPIIKTLYSNLQNNSLTNNVFNNKKLIVSQRQPPSLKRLLTRAEFGQGITGVFKCNKPRCLLCSIIITGSSFYFSKSQTKFEIKSYMTCNAMNCIYVLKCSGCSFIYIGETSNFRLRTNLHRDHSNKGYGLYVSQHIHNCTKNISCPRKFTIMPFYAMKTEQDNIRKCKEAYFIQKFMPELNREC